MTFLSITDLYERWTYTKAGIYKLIKRDDFPKPFTVVSKGKVKIFREADVIDYEKNKPWLFDKKKKEMRQRLFFILVNSK